jgi:glycosyltransferase involved in cell wall biosynthesis
MLYSFQKVLFVGPADKQGGMGAVLRSYKKSISAFNLITTHDNEKLNLFYFPLQFLKIFKFIILNDDLEIVHIHSASKGSFLRKSLVLLLSKALHKKVVFHIHGGGFVQFYSTNQFLKNLVQWILSRADVLICLSEEWKLVFKREGFNKYIVQLNNPVHNFPAVVKVRDHTILKLLFLGRISAQKGLFDLLDYLRYNDYFKNGMIKLTIGGTGDIEQLNEYLEDEVFKSHVTYLGWLNEDAKEKQFLANDIFILPSYYEGLPVSILEAMAAQMPIIATNVGGIPSVVQPGTNGWLFDAGSFSCLDQVLGDLLKNKHLIADYGIQSLRLVQPYMADRIIGDLSDVYSSI